MTDNPASPPPEPEPAGWWARLRAALARVRKTFGGYWGGI